MKEKNKTANLLKLASIIILGLSILGALLTATQTVSTIEQLYDWADPQLVEKQVFNFAIFLSAMLQGIVAALIIYGFGELVQIQADSRDSLDHIKKNN